MAYAAIEPFGEYRSELRHGQQMHLIDRAAFKRDTPLAVLDFMNFIEKPQEKQLTPEEAFAKIDADVFGV